MLFMPAHTFRQGQHLSRPARSVALCSCSAGQLLNLRLLTRRASELVPDYPKMEDIDFENLIQSFAEHAKLHAAA